MGLSKTEYVEGGIAACKKGYMKALAKLQKMNGPILKVKMAKAMAPKTRAPEPVVVDGIYIVFFDLNSSQLSSASQRVLRKAAAEFALTDTPGMNITGHTDMSGPSNYNQALSRRRLDSVSSFLLKMGALRTALLPSAYGETKPLVLTKNGTKEKRNLRVEIIFE